MLWITPTWPAPTHVKALSTLRHGGVSPNPFDTFNFGSNVGDNPFHITENRQRLRVQANLPSEPAWLSQIHGIQVIHLESVSRTQENLFPKLEADASICFSSELVCAVTTADCLPVLLCDKKGSRIAAIHAGWRGLAAGIIETTIQSLDCDPSLLIAWLGPAIGSSAFEVGIDVKKAFSKPGDEQAFHQKNSEKWLADLYQLAKLRLKEKGITEISGGEYCTFTDQKRFYSFRRSHPESTGRMATLIWLEN